MSKKNDIEEIQVTNNMYVLLSEDNRLSVVSADRQSEEQFVYNFPEDFDFSDIINWKIIDGELVHDEFPIQIIEEDGVDIASRIEEMSDTLDILLTEILPNLMGLE